ncbi:hypothetical protein ABZ319_07980 [Nocardia sp. NPDC005978]|uniref:hypothetical protein n=1 Tax=Nocardia sp. NPDC005978 TaxID=3156725 RepID=UPI0033A4D0C3
MEQEDGTIPAGEYVITARSLDEYRAMFGLGDGQVRGRILDCPGGGSSFAAEAGVLGAEVIAVDPVYAMGGERLRREVLGAIENTGWATAHPERFVWDFYGDIAGHQAIRERAAARFLADLDSNPRRYRAGLLPELDFPDAYFDLVLSSHLLFTYADRLDYDFHLAALRELLRVSAGQVRVFPLVDYLGGSCEDLIDALSLDLAADGVRAERVPVEFEFQHGATSMLRLRRG